MTPAELDQRSRADAKLRAIRAFTWGLLLDITVAVVLILGVAFTAIEWTKEYWIGLGLSLAKSVLQAVVTYIARRVLPPKI